MPSSSEWETFMQWARDFNTDILHLEVPGSSIIVLDTYEAAVELLEKRSRTYSGRPNFPMAVDLMELDFNFAFKPYGERDRRRLMHGAMHPTAVGQYHTQQLKATHAFLRAMLSAGEDDVEKELRHLAGMVIMDVAYGICVAGKDDLYIKEAGEVVQIQSVAALPSSYLVNSIPALKFVPELVPGAGFKRIAREWRDKARKITYRPFYDVKSSMVRCGEIITPSFISSAIEKGEDDAVIVDAAATMHTAGIDTTAITLVNFVLGMLDNPIAQRRAQAELDAVLGPLQTSDGTPGQLPVHADEPRLPFITAFVRESLRWMPALPISIPHAYTGEEPDIYKGYAIPPGSLVIPNVWSMCHDERMYPDPYTFKPERFLTPEGTLDPSVHNPAELAFGFGRRNCVGRHFAYDETWLTVASILRVYNIEKAKRPDGSPVEPRREWRSGILLQPMQYKCRFVPRSSEAVDLIKSTQGAVY
ncbi:cytochrome P450 [Schizophyllum commune H4-8]|uniref:Cytochrome P450 n=1 Tax=Schizophyllum commune (strain H4-8 / FGSC 9210) TaxID=578458 RepID=D8QDV8_SCHCM|nr:cytochrome P450 [Schizophyllum commune H4-8]KAI5888559.1 cytochrome P450 [Schizophyllum commune H4-8]